MKTPCLETERLILRPVEIGDLQEAYEKWFSDPDVAKYMFWGVHESTFRTREWLQFELEMIDAAGWYRFIVTNKEEESADTCFGSVLLYFDEELSNWEIAYHFEKKSWGRGLATESLWAVLLFAGEKLRITHVMARYATENTASWKVLQKTGFRRYKSIDYWCNDHKVHMDGWLCGRELVT